MGSKKGYIEREENFYYGIDMKCARSVHFTLLLITWDDKITTNFQGGNVPFSANSLHFGNY